MAYLDGYQTIDRYPVYSGKLDNGYEFEDYGHYEEITYKKEPTKSPCYVIVTCRSLVWTCLSLITNVIIITAIITPQWLVGRPRWSRVTSSNDTLLDPIGLSYSPTIGLYNRCTMVHKYGGVKSESCGTFITGFDMSTDDFPDTWKSALILFSVAAIFMAFTNFTALFSLCIQAIFKKSIFTVSGLMQSLAALFLILGQVLYPAGWSSRRVKDLCGQGAGPFLIDDCHIGWAYYACMGGTALLFVCALLSIQAEKSTSTDRVEDKIIEGKRVICIV